MFWKVYMFYKEVQENWSKEQKIEIDRMNDAFTSLSSVTIEFPTSATCSIFKIVTLFDPDSNNPIFPRRNSNY